MGALLPRGGGARAPLVFALSEDLFSGDDEPFSGFGRDANGVYFA